MLIASSGPPGICAVNVPLFAAVAGSTGCGALGGGAVDPSDGEAGDAGVVLLELPAVPV